MACRLPESVLQRIWNGYYPGRSGEIQIVPKEPNFQGGGGLTHSGPWDYLQEVPMFLYGRGYVPARGPIDRPATTADVAPTIAEYLGYDFEAPDGRPLSEALLPDAQRAEAPRLIFVVVWDGGGRIVLREYPESWPTVRRLIPQGVWFERFTDGSSPSTTPAIHTTLGTGAFPRHHGLIDQRFKVAGRLGLVPAHQSGPYHLKTPALADLYDRHMGNRPKVGVVAYQPWHMGMIGQGSFLKGGDRDLAAFMDRKTGRWGVAGANRKYFSFPSYVNDVPGLERAIDRTDLEDGRRDGAWFGSPVLDDPSILVKTPAYAEWQTAILREVIRREGYGADSVPDLLFTNYKMIDDVGHQWTLNSRQMQSVVRASDRAFGELIGILDEEVGPGRWVIALTADHGVTPKPSVSGAFPILNGELEEDIERTFGGEIVQDLRPTQIWIKMDVLKAKGYQLSQVAEYIARYTKGQNLEDPSEIAPEARNDLVYAAAFPSRILKDLPCLGAEGSTTGR